MYIYLFLSELFTFLECMHIMVFINCANVYLKRNFLMHLSMYLDILECVDIQCNQNFFPSNELLKKFLILMDL